MNGGYQMLDLSGINFTTDAAGSEITDANIKAKIVEAINCDKPVLAYGFRGGNGPNFAHKYNTNSVGGVMVTTAIDVDTSKFWAYHVVWTKATGVVKAYSKPHTLS